MLLWAGKTVCQHLHLTENHVWHKLKTCLYLTFWISQMHPLLGAYKNVHPLIKPSPPPARLELSNLAALRIDIWSKSISSHSNLAWMVIQMISEIGAEIQWEFTWAFFDCQAQILSGQILYPQRISGYIVAVYQQIFHLW